MWDCISELKAFRVQIDACIKTQVELAEKIGREDGGRECALVKTKLQEAKMWTGKIMEAMGSELPEEFRDEAK